MLPMNLRIIERWFWRLSPWCQGCEQLVVFLEQRKNDRGHLAGQPSNHFLAANQRRVRSS
jgi:hypothetical protein